MPEAPRSDGPSVEPTHPTPALEALTRLGAALRHTQERLDMYIDDLSAHDMVPTRGDDTVRHRVAAVARGRGGR